MLTEDNKVSEEHINEIFNQCKFQTRTFFGNCTVVVCQLPNGYTLVEHSACIDPANYDVKLGKELCMNRFKDRIWALEGYVGANEFASKKA